ncbi:uncharacterized protein METZ01_LOCUS512875, partial [marine metagenome]
MSNVARVWLLILLVTLGCSVGLTAQELDRLYVDQYMPLRSELMVADADGSHPR